MEERPGNQHQGPLLDRVKPQLTTLLRILLLRQLIILPQGLPQILRLILRQVQQSTRPWRQHQAQHLRLHLIQRPDLPLNQPQSLRTNQLLCQRPSPLQSLSRLSLLCRLLLVLTTGLPQDPPLRQLLLLRVLTLPQVLLPVRPQAQLLLLPPRLLQPTAP